MKNCGFLLSTIFLCTCLSAQEETKPSFLKPYSVEISGGINVYRDYSLSLEEMKMIAPGSELINGDYSSFEESNLYFTTTTTNSFFSAKAQFLPYSKKKKSSSQYTTFHIGFTYGNVQLQGPSYTKNKNYRFDTLVASNGTNYYVDSVSNDYAIFNWSEKLFGLDVGQTFHTNDSRIFSCWIGYGIQLAMGLDTRFNAYSYSSDYTHISGNYNPNTNTTTTYFTSDPSHTSQVKNESIRTKNVFVPRLYFPVGFQFRFSRKENPWNKLAFTVETRVNMDVQPVPNSVTLTRFSLNQAVGLKYYFAYNSSK